jgi:hypothetical protein
MLVHFATIWYILWPFWSILRAFGIRILWPFGNFFVFFGTYVIQRKIWQPWFAFRAENFLIVASLSRERRIICSREKKNGGHRCNQGDRGSML